MIPMVESNISCYYPMWVLLLQGLGDLYVEVLPFASKAT